MLRLSTTKVENIIAQKTLQPRLSRRRRPYGMGMYHCAQEDTTDFYRAA